MNHYQGLRSILCPTLMIFVSLNNENGKERNTGDLSSLNFISRNQTEWKNQHRKYQTECNDLQLICRTHAKNIGNLSKLYVCKLYLTTLTFVNAHSGTHLQLFQKYRADQQVTHGTKEG